MTKPGQDINYLDELLYLIKDFRTDVNELYNQSKLNFTDHYYCEILANVNQICCCFSMKEKICDKSNYSLRNQSNSNIYEEIAKSMEDIKEDLEGAIKDIENEEKLSVRPKRTVGIKFFDYWESLLDKQKQINNNSEQSSYEESTSFVKRRVQQFNKDRRKSSTVYSLSNIRNYNVENKFENSGPLHKSRSMNVICENNENQNASTLADTPITPITRNNMTDIYTFIKTYKSDNLIYLPDDKPKIVSGLVSKSK